MVELILRKEKAMEEKKSTYATVGLGLNVQPQELAHHIKYLTL